MKKWLKQKCSQMKIFISYAREDAVIAAEIVQALRNRNDIVFHDESSLPPGSDFNERIQSAIQEADRYVFLLSPHSIQPDSYVKTELSLTKKQWPSPVGRVWPVSLDPDMKISEIDPYLRSVNIMVTDGNLPASLAAEIDRSRSYNLKCQVVFSLLALMIISSITWLGYSQIYINKRELITFTAPFSVGHYTGAPSIIVRMSIKNQTNDNKNIDNFQAFLTGPNGKSSRIDQEGVLTNGFITPQHLFYATPGYQFTWDNIMLSRPASLIGIHQKITKKLIDLGFTNNNMWDINEDIVPNDLLSELKTNALKEFIWTEGKWTLTFKYNINGKSNEKSWTFILSSDDIGAMKSSFADYGTGAGVMPGWRFFGSGALAYRQVDLLEDENK